MANRGTLLPAVEERDWDALEMKLKEMEKISVETNGVDPVPMEVEDIDDVENTVDEIQSDSESSDFHEHESRTTVAVTTSSLIKPTPDSTPNKIPLLSAPQEEKMEVAAASPAQSSTLPASARPQSTPFESPAIVSSTGSETICASEVNFDDYADCVLDDEDLAKELSDW